jgi:hypothetical protein
MRRFFVFKVFVNRQRYLNIFVIQLLEMNTVKYLFVLKIFLLSVSTKAQIKPDSNKKIIIEYVKELTKEETRRPKIHYDSIPTRFKAIDTVAIVADVYTSYIIPVHQVLEFSVINPTNDTLFFLGLNKVRPYFDYLETMNGKPLFVDYYFCDVGIKYFKMLPKTCIKLPYYVNETKVNAMRQIRFKYSINNKDNPTKIILSDKMLF